MTEKEQIKDLKSKIRAAKKHLRDLKEANRRNERLVENEIMKLSGALFDITDPVISESHYNSREMLGRKTVHRMSLDPTLSESDSRWSSLG